MSSINIKWNKFETSETSCIAVCLVKFSIYAREALIKFNMQIKTLTKLHMEKVMSVWDSVYQIKTPHEVEPTDYNHSLFLHL